MTDNTPAPESSIFAYGDAPAGTATSLIPPGAQPPGAEAPAQAPRNRRKLLLILIAIFVVILALIAGAFMWYAVTKKPLSQLPILSSQTPPHYAATMYDVAQPIGVAVDAPNNRVYVTQTSGDRTVAVFDLGGTRIGSLSMPGPKGALHTPVYAAVDPTTSNVYVSDRATAKVYVFDSTGKYLKEFIPQGMKAWQPLGLSFDKAGNLYVTDVSAPVQKVLKITPDGKVALTMGEKDDLSFPNGAVADADGSVYVTDSNHSRVLKYGADGKLIGPLARGAAETPLGLPRGITIDDRGRIYVVDTTNQNFQVFTPADSPTALPEYAFTAGGEGTTEGLFEYPNGIAADDRGHVYVTDRENNRVQVWSY